MHALLIRNESLQAPFEEPACDGHAQEARSLAEPRIEKQSIASLPSEQGAQEDFLRPSAMRKWEEGAPKGVGFARATLAAMPGDYDERWLQKLLFAHPELIPIDKIELGATPLVES